MRRVPDVRDAGAHLLEPAEVVTSWSQLSQSLDLLGAGHWGGLGRRLVGDGGSVRALQCAHRTPACGRLVAVAAAVYWLLDFVGRKALGLRRKESLARLPDEPDMSARLSAAGCLNVWVAYRACW